MAKIRLPSGIGNLVPDHQNGAGNLAPPPLPISPGRGGVKHKLTTLFLSQLHQVWEKHGIKAIEKLAKNDPRSFVTIVAALVPKEQVIDETQRVYIIRDEPLTAEEWQAQFSDEPMPEVH